MNGPDADTLRRGLADIGEGIAAQMAALEAMATPERAERCAYNLDGARIAVLRLRESLIREGTGDDQCER